MSKLVIISTHPIQYYAPLYRMLTERDNVRLKVFYTWSQAKEKVKDAGFGKDIQWDIPLLEGYEYEFVENKSKQTAKRNFWSIQNPGLIDKIKAYNPDAILVFGWNFHSHLQVMRHFKGKIPVWFRGDSHLLDETPGLKTMARRLFLKWIYKHVDKAFYVGTNNKNYFLKHGLKEEQLVFAPHAIDNRRFFDDEEKQYEKKAAAWRRNLSYKEEDIVVLFAGKFEPVKNLELLIDAFNFICENNKSTNLRLLLIGNGILETRLKQKADKNQFVRFLPFQNQSQMPIIYRIGNLFCLPSKSETWGLAINEAMACGRPVIVSDKVGCAVDLVKKGERGNIFDYHEMNELVEIFGETNKEQLNIMAESSSGFIRKWSFINICEAIEQELTC